ncbi:hypothetical protein LEP1GSC104_2259 [Leptospira interrogans str. UI 12621]|uniref:Uncharacterized protein n=1 Tax=Leptospira interrogans str. UI 12621 TaxID=1049937 RepID=A0A0F6H7Q1_LEPIR|nr:hypothetical protein LEP1GSC080_1849 [Leptospira interrogans str. FPW2026]EKO24262.1 hypothetical protein LEP1GSC104_2259 [Leptospira interrogans str. UI 12621]
MGTHTELLFTKRYQFLQTEWDLHKSFLKINFSRTKTWELTQSFFLLKDINSYEPNGIFIKVF